MKNILCFGDSNTWGYDATNDERFNSDERWTKLLEKQLSGSANIYEAGIPDMTFGWDSNLADRNGLKQIYAFVTSAMPLDLVIITLGTNDCKTVFHSDAEEIGKMAKQVINKVLKHEWAEAYSTKVLLVAPVSMDERVAKTYPETMSMDSVELSKKLKNVLRKEAAETDQYFADADSWNVELDFDGCHYTREGHIAFAEGIYAKLRNILEL